MAKLFILFLAFIAVMAPVAFFMLPESGENGKTTPKRKNRDRRNDEIPMVYRLTKIPVAILVSAGIGDLCDKYFSSDRTKLVETLSSANLKLRTATVYCTQVFLSLFLGGFFALFTAALVSGENAMTVPLAGIFGVFAGCVLPRTALANIVQKKRAQMLAAIPYSIDLITSALRGGLDFSAAIRFYVKIAAAGPLTDEYAKMLREMELGVIRTDAIQNMAARVKIKEFSAFVAAVVLGTELGSPISETMEIQGEEMRRTRFAIAENKAQRAPSLMLIPMALFIMPAVFIIILTPVFLRMGESGISLF